MDGSARQGRALPYGERDVTELLDSCGQQLYLYFWLMLGDELSATRALTDTIIAVLPDPDHRELHTVARRVCRQYQPVPAVPNAAAEAATLAAVTIAALRRLDPDDREICVLGAPQYRLDDTDLATVLGARTVDDLRFWAAAAFGSVLAACASDAGLEQGGNLAAQALRLVGSKAVALPYDEIVSLATDAEVGPAPDRPLGALGTGQRAVVTFTDIQAAERATTPLPRVTHSETDPPGSWGRRALVGTALAGAIPAAIAGAAVLAGHSPHTSHAAHSGLHPAAQAPAPSRVPRSPTRSATSSPAQMHSTKPHGSAGQGAPPATMPAEAPMTTTPSAPVMPTPTFSTPVKVTASPTTRTMSPTPTVPPTHPPTVAPTTTTSATPSPSDT